MTRHDHATLAHLRIGDLASVVALFELRSFSLVARSQGVTHSQVSKTLDRVEARLGVKLFERTTRALVPTADAARVARAFQDCLLSLVALDTRQASLAPLRLAVSSLLIDLALDLRERLPTEIGDIREVTPEALVQNPTQAPFELALVDDQVRVAQGWVTMPLGTSHWALFGPESPASTVPVGAEDGPALPPLKTSPLIFARLQQALGYAIRRQCPVWAPPWAINFAGAAFGPSKTPSLTAPQNVRLLCHPERVSASVARAMADLWRVQLGLTSPGS